MSTVDIFNETECQQDSMKGHANRLFGFSLAGGNSIRKLANGDLPNRLWVSIILEFLFFYITLTHGEGLKEASEAQRNKTTERLVDMLIARTVEVIFDDPALADEYKVVAMQRINEYERFPMLMPSEAEGKVERSALWAFCTTVSKLATHPDDLTFIMTAQSHINDSLLILKMQHLSLSPTANKS